eukprot:TRINITY_DN29163_c0_g1_i1.p1 TRINITY_DN29163_c0_g1~~TRINITY_DN29163_c0_g1_i1.p1  ORF type:complete len:312 (-),score=32.77 TRINITY_DN29163_c0_g1_i1:14-949(-)
MRTRPGAGRGRFVNSLVAATFATGLLVWLSGIHGQDEELAIFWDIIWLVPGNAVGLYMIIAFCSRIIKQLEKDVPLLVCLTNFIWSTWATFYNVTLASALFFAIVSTVYCYSVILGYHAAEWLHILCINAVSWTGALLIIWVLCMGFMETSMSKLANNLIDAYPIVLSIASFTASLMIWCRLPYGPATCIIATVTNFNGFQHISWFCHDCVNFDRPRLEDAVSADTLHGQGISQCSDLAGSNNQPEWTSPDSIKASAEATEQLVARLERAAAAAEAAAARFERATATSSTTWSSQVHGPGVRTAEPLSRKH